MKLFEDIGPRFKARPGGYTRILRMGPRPGDNAPMALMQLVDKALAEQKAEPSDDKSASKPKKKAKAKAAADSKPKAKKAKADADTAPAKKKKKKASA